MIRALALLFAAIHTGAVAPLDGFIRKSDVPDTGKDSTSLPNGVVFQPALDSADPLVAAQIKKAQERFLGKSDASGEATAYEKQFIDGTETYYDEYSQAWRLLGFYIDCNYSGEQEGGGGNNNNGGTTGCRRILLWAAVSRYT